MLFICDHVTAVLTLLLPSWGTKMLGILRWALPTPRTNLVVGPCKIFYARSLDMGCSKAFLCCLSSCKSDEVGSLQNFAGTLLHLIAWLHVYNIGCNANRIMRTMHYHLYLMCSCPMRTKHFNKIQSVQFYILVIVAYTGNDESCKIAIQVSKLELRC